MITIVVVVVVVVILHLLLLLVAVDAKVEKGSLKRRGRGGCGARG